MSFGTVIGALLGWACGHIAYHSGLSSTILSRYFGFGKQGSVIASLIFAFMIIDFSLLKTPSFITTSFSVSNLRTPPPRRS